MCSCSPARFSVFLFPSQIHCAPVPQLESVCLFVPVRFSVFLCPPDRSYCQLCSHLALVLLSALFAPCPCLIVSFVRTLLLSPLSALFARYPCLLQSPCSDKPIQQKTLFQRYLLLTQPTTAPPRNLLPFQILPDISDAFYQIPIRYTPPLMPRGRNSKQQRRQQRKEKRKQKKQERAFQRDFQYPIDKEDYTDRDLFDTDSRNSEVNGDASVYRPFEWIEPDPSESDHESGDKAVDTWRRLIDHSEPTEEPDRRWEEAIVPRSRAQFYTRWGDYV